MLRSPSFSTRRLSRTFALPVVSLDFASQEAEGTRGIYVPDGTTFDAFFVISFVLLVMELVGDKGENQPRDMLPHKLLGTRTRGDTALTQIIPIWSRDGYRV